ncbi:MAG: hypothetical protein RL291_1804 [Pseudomonadota bacterium]|jgi:protein-L-isoaspartate(D-aspartate) O-methyltransferase
MQQTSQNKPLVLSPTATVTADFVVQRHNMVESQVRPSDVVDRRITKAMTDVARELFVPQDRKAIAYMDSDVPLTSGRNGRVLLAPRTFAKLLALADIPDDATVLDIGSAYGYSTAILARFAKSVIGLEVDPAMVAAARGQTEAQKIGNATIIEGPLAAGHGAKAPYDAILINGAVTAAPAQLFDQLKDGGRLVAILGAGAHAKACVWRRAGQHTTLREAFDASAPVLPGFEAKPAFVF